MVLFTHTITPRLKYITEFVGREIFGQDIQLTTDKAFFHAYQGPAINYSKEKIRNKEFQVVPHGLLFEKYISAQQTVCFDWSRQKAFFQTPGDIPFDIFAASFYLISRYEEYLPHKKDEYGRYHHEESLAYKEDFLDKPLVNKWLKKFGEELKQVFPGLVIRDPPFSFLPTYDIDMAWSFLHKGPWRTMAGFTRSILTLKWKQLRFRMAVLNKKQGDPFAAYEWMDAFHKKYHLTPKYFFLLAEKNGRYDKNILPDNPAMQELVKQHSQQYSVGIHPSWQSGDKHSLLKTEIDQLHLMTGKKIIHSRQHYIRFTFPITFQQLIENGILYDYSMGYGGINGFRASIASPFYWYDLEKEEQTRLLLFPYCFMDANSFYEQKNNAQQALHEMRHYHRAVNEVNGTLIMIWHNSFLGTDPMFNGWREAYESFIKGLAYV